MNEYNKSYQKLVEGYKAKDLHSHFFQQEENLHEMQHEYKRNPTNALLLELCYQDFLVDTCGDVIRKKEEEEISLVNDEEWDHSKEYHDNQADEESMDDFWVANWGIGYDYSIDESPIET